MEFDMAFASIFKSNFFFSNFSLFVVLVGISSIQIRIAVLPNFLMQAIIFINCFWFCPTIIKETLVFESTDISVYIETMYYFFCGPSFEKSQNFQESASATWWSPSCASLISALSSVGLYTTWSHLSIRHFLGRPVLIIGTVDWGAKSIFMQQLEIEFGRTK